MFDSVAYSTRQPTSEDLPFNSDWDQERHSLARFNANCYRRIQYANDQRQNPAQLALHRAPRFGAFVAERVLGCPSLFWPERTNPNGNPTG